MNILEFMEVYHRCEVSARLCVSAIELDYDYIAELSAADYDVYQRFIRQLPPHWIALLHKAVPIIEVEMVWSSYSLAEWEELIKYNPEWGIYQAAHYRAPKFFAGF